MVLLEEGGKETLNGDTSCHNHWPGSEQVLGLLHYGGENSGFSARRFYAQSNDYHRRARNKIT